MKGVQDVPPSLDGGKLRWLRNCVY
jgi:hypothetical protein